MKKLLLLFFSILFCVNIFAQDKTVASPYAGTFWGAETDTLIASDTIQYSILMRSKQVVDITFTLQLTKVSGTVTNEFVVYGSNILDEGAYVSLDTITNTDAVTGYSNIHVDSFNYKYLIVKGIAGAITQKAWYKGTYVIRFD